MLIEVLTDEALGRVLEQVDRYGHPRDRVRWRALFTLLILYGARISEILMLTWEQVDWEKGRITFPTLKRWKTVNGVRVRESVSRTLPLLPVAAEALRAHEETSPRGPMVFPVTTRKAGRTTANRAFHRLLHNAGLPHYRLHDLRHTAATRILRHTKDLLVARDTLGHANISTTDQYLHAIDLDEKLRSVPVPFQDAKPEGGGGPAAGVAPPPSPRPVMPVPAKPPTPAIRSSTPPTPHPLSPPAPRQESTRAPKRSGRPQEPKAAPPSAVRSDHQQPTPAVPDSPERLMQLWAAAPAPQQRPSVALRRAIAWKWTPKRLSGSPPRMIWATFCRAQATEHLAWAESPYSSPESRQARIEQALKWFALRWLPEAEAPAQLRTHGVVV